MNLSPLVPLDEELSPIERLSEKQRVFVWEYLRCLNATQAAKAAGYSESWAGQSGWQLVEREDIKAAIVYEQTRRLAKYEAASHRVIQELCAIMFVNPKEFTKADGTLDPAKMTDDHWRAVASISETKFGLRATFHNKIAAIETFSKLLGLAAPERVDVNMTGEVKRIERVILDHLANPDAT